MKGDEKLYDIHILENVKFIISQRSRESGFRKHSLTNRILNKVRNFRNFSEFPDVVGFFRKINEFPKSRTKLLRKKFWLANWDLRSKFDGNSEAKSLEHVISCLLDSTKAGGF